MSVCSLLSISAGREVKARVVGRHVGHVERKIVYQDSGAVIDDGRERKIQQLAGQS